MSRLIVETALEFGQLDEESIKEKKKQRLLKAGWEARARARREKEKEREEKEAEEKRDEDERENNFDEWANRLRREQEVCRPPRCRSCSERTGSIVGSDE